MVKLKDSGVQWLGKIPDTWDLTTIGNVYEQRNEKISEEDCRPLSVTMDGIVPQLDFVAKSADTSNRKHVCKNDFVINSRSDRRGSYGVSDYEGSCSLINIVLRPKIDDVRYYAYVLKSKFFPDEFYRWGTGIVSDLWSTHWEQMKRIPVTDPPEKIRIKIANYLDSKCVAIDDAIKKSNLLISEYKALKKAYIVNTITHGIDRNVPKKDSGIIWMPKIPITWKVTKIKRVIFPQSKEVHDSDDIVTCFRDGEVTLRKKRREEGYTLSYTEHGYQGVDVGDLVIHGMDAFAGAIGCSDSRGKTTPVVHVCKTAGNNRFFMYALRNMAYSDVLMDFSNGIRVRSSDYRNFSKLGVFDIAIPSIEEQNKIAEFLDEKCSLIDSLIRSHEFYIQTLKEYKKILIYEYVTGKKEVPMQ